MLTDLQCKNAICAPDKKRERLYDSGGLYLQVEPNGSKRWFLKYRIAGKEKQLALGSYPAVGLVAARKSREDAKEHKSAGRDPVLVRKVEKLKASVSPDEKFKAVAEEWYKKQAPQWSDSHAKRTLSQLTNDLFPHLGARRMSDIEPVELLATVRKVEERGAYETAERCLMTASQIWRYAVSTGRVERDIAQDLKGALTPYRGKHFAAITDPQKLGQLMLAIRAYQGGPIVRTALQLAPLLFQRPGELRAAEWSEIDLEAGLWTIPSARMKRTKTGKESGDAHLVPLSTQAVKLFKALLPYTGGNKLVFPGERSHERPISDNSVRTALITLG